MEQKIINVPTAQQSSNPVTTQVNFFDPSQFATAQRMSQLFASSMLVPDTYQVEKIYQDKLKGGLKQEEAFSRAKMTATANCMIAIDIATRIGASPLMVMQNLAIIYGRPSWSSKFLIATVNTCGRFEPLKFRFTEKGNIGKHNYTEYVKNWVSTTNGKGYYKKEAVTKQLDGTKIQNIECVAYTTARGSKELLESSPVSIQLAIDEGWYTKAGSKWRTMPRQMLMYRAASFWTSAYAPELSMGMHTIEEVQDAEAVEIKEENATEQLLNEKRSLVKEDVDLNGVANDIDSKNNIHNQVKMDEQKPKQEAMAQTQKVDHQTGEIFPNTTPDSQPKKEPSSPAY